MFLGFTGEAAGWTQAVAQSAIESHTASLTWAPVRAAVKSLVLDLTCVRPLQVFQSAAEFRPKFSSSSTLWRDPNGRRSESFLWTTSRSSWKVINFILFVFKWIEVRSNEPFRHVLNKLLVSFSIPIRRRYPFRIVHPYVSPSCAPNISGMKGGNFFKFVTYTEHISVHHTTIQMILTRCYTNVQSDRMMWSCDIFISKKSKVKFIVTSWYSAKKKKKFWLLLQQNSSGTATWVIVQHN